jgi:8-oxo-dGTP pyrophosphatase MutT (NUDIX family)
MNSLDLRGLVGLWIDGARLRRACGKLGAAPGASSFRGPWFLCSSCAGGSGSQHRERRLVDLTEVRSWAERFMPGADARGQASREAVLALLGSTPDPAGRRQYDPGHVTASGIVLTPDAGRVALVFHQGLGRWLQPGGHVEPDDTSIVGAAAREVREETGILVDPRMEPAVVGVDVHEIPPRGVEPGHRHFDLVFRFVAPAGARLAPPGQRRAVWCAVNRLTDFDVDEPLLAAVRRAVTLTVSGKWLNPEA